jgi:hypothetical protein
LKDFKIGKGHRNMKIQIIVLSCLLVVGNVNAQLSVYTAQGTCFEGDHNEEPHGQVVMINENQEEDLIFGGDENNDDQDTFLWKLCLLKKVPLKVIRWLLGKPPLVCGDGESEIMIDDIDDNEESR